MLEGSLYVLSPIELFGAGIRGSEVNKGHNDTTLVGGRPYFDRIQRSLEQIAPG